MMSGMIGSERRRKRGKNEGEEEGRKWERRKKMSEIGG